MSQFYTSNTDYYLLSVDSDGDGGNCYVRATVVAADGHDRIEYELYVDTSSRGVDGTKHPDN